MDPGNEKILCSQQLPFLEMMVMLHGGGGIDSAIMNHGGMMIGLGMGLTNHGP